jgi:uncharacterized membrane protein YcaP (DUF421 family)
MENGDGALAALRHLLGIDVPAIDMDVGQVIARAVVIYLAGLLILRVGQHRFLGKNTAFDIVLGFVLGSMLSRAVNGSAALLPTIAACAGLVALHWLFALGSFRSKRFGTVVKGESRLLVRDGEIDWKAMRRGQIGIRDLEETLRSDGRAADVSQVREAYLERSGQISIIPKRRQPRVVEVDVADGVQTVRVVVE